MGWLKHLNISLQCRGNGVDWQSGNTVRISDSVIQGYAQYGVRAGTRRGGYGGFDIDNVYEEVGACTNPLGKIGQAGVIAQGGNRTDPRGRSACRKHSAVRAHGETGISLLHCCPARETRRLESAVCRKRSEQWIRKHYCDDAGHRRGHSFDLLRVTPAGDARKQAPYGNGNYAVATNVARASACANGVCRFTRFTGRASAL